MSSEVISACGWCRRVLKGDATAAEVDEAMESGTNEIRGRAISHGICPDCKDDVLEEFQKGIMNDEYAYA